MERRSISAYVKQKTIGRIHIDSIIPGPDVTLIMQLRGRS